MYQGPVSKGSFARYNHQIVFFGKNAVKRGSFCIKFTRKDIDNKKLCKYTSLVCIRRH